MDLAAERKKIPIGIDLTAERKIPYRDFSCTGDFEFFIFPCTGDFDFLQYFPCTGRLWVSTIFFVYQRLCKMKIIYCRIFLGLQKRSLDLKFQNSQKNIYCALVEFMKLLLESMFENNLLPHIMLCVNMWRNVYIWGSRWNSSRRGRRPTKAGSSNKSQSFTSCFFSLHWTCLFGFKFP